MLCASELLLLLLLLRAHPRTSSQSLHNLIAHRHACIRRQRNDCPDAKQIPPFECHVTPPPNCRSHRPERKSSTSTSHPFCFLSFHSTLSLSSGAHPTVPISTEYTAYTSPVNPANSVKYRCSRCTTAYLPRAQYNRREQSRSSFISTLNPLCCAGHHPSPFSPCPQSHQSPQNIYSMLGRLQI